MEPNQVIITIEHCSNCDLHPTTTRHDESRYLEYAARLQNAIQEAFPFIEVHCKPTKDLTIKESPCGVDGAACWSMGRPTSIIGRWPRESSANGLPTPRLGAFEMQMAVWQHGDSWPVVSLLHSKIASCTWPNTNRVVKSIAERLPAKRLKVTVQVFDYEDGKASEVPAPSVMILTAAAGARVETTELLKDSDERPPVAQVEIPMGCTSVLCAATDSTLENSGAIDQAQAEEGAGAHSLRLLTIPIHTCPMIRCVIRVSQEGNWSPDLAMITATKPVAGSSWRAESPITESGEAWLFPPSDREHVDCRDLHLALKVGDGFGAWQFMDMRQMHPYGTTNLLVEFPVIREILFDPVDVTTGQTVPGGEARMTSMNGNLTPERGWTSVSQAYYLEPGHYKVLVRAPGCFDCTQSFTINPSSDKSLPVMLRPKLSKKLGKEEMETDEAPEKMLSMWCPSRGAGEVDVVFVIEESDTMKNGVLCLHRTLGGGGGASELAQYVVDLPQCNLPQMSVVTYKGISKAQLAPPPDDAKGDKKGKGGAGGEGKKKLEELKQDAVSVRLPFSNNWAGLKVGVQAADPTGPRDDSYEACREAIKVVCNNLPWRANAARLAIFVTDASPQEDGNTLTPKEVHGTPHEASTSFLPETLVDGVAMLRAHGISACACLVGGPEDAKGNFLVDMEFARMYQAIVAETGGTVGCASNKGVGSSVVSVGAVDVTLHQQIVDDFVNQDPFKDKLQSLFEGSPGTSDELTIKVETYNLCAALAGQMNDFGILARELAFHTDTGKPQVMCVPVKASNVATGILHNVIKGNMSIRPEVMAVLKASAISSWDR
eukprot:CAMPEP_0114255068 /NCGR_PEP_ID=MMETSP0058-20121206/17351_1 /TAXON_ID=36894 /ORGANISM="Pyramimonas parkeae, CCMP726" /LENGTH=828 /DNA_ID=CAMNT_0001369401 /DNA_START=505 /DNA_END=2991 /DNA_ORIENTATION=+